MLLAALVIVVVDRPTSPDDHDPDAPPPDLGPGGLDDEACPARGRWRTMVDVKLRVVLVLAVLTVVLSGCSSGPGPAGPDPTAERAPSSRSVVTAAAPPPTSSHRWQHVVVVVEENRDAKRILGSRRAPYLNRLARGGLVLTDMHGETHPSQPNYLALFSGTTQRVRGDACPHTFRGDNLARQLRVAHRTFAAYSEGLPRTGSRVCRAGKYVRRHAPWTNFTNVPRTVQRPLSAFPRNLATLPAVSFVVPDLNHDMHDGSVARGDRWLRAHLGRYAAWARTHHSLLLVTWDEDENTRANHIATLAYGDGVTPGRWTQRADHYSLLATLERSFRLPALGHARHAAVITPLV